MEKNLQESKRVKKKTWWSKRNLLKEANEFFLEKASFEWKERKREQY